MDRTTEEVIHYGIKGMKWGVRRTPEQLGRARGRTSSESEDVKTAKAARRKIGRRGNTDALSNAELQSVVNRMNLEQQYKRLQGPSRSSRITKKGASFAGGVVEGVAKQTATKLLSKQTDKVIADLINKK